MHKTKSLVFDILGSIFLTLLLVIATASGIGMLLAIIRLYAIWHGLNLAILILVLFLDIAFAVFISRLLSRVYSSIKQEI